MRGFELAITDRTGSAVRAAVEVVRGLGLRPTDPVILQETNRAVIWLRPEPVVAKVGRDAANLRAENSLATALVAAGGPVAAPYGVIGPVEHEPSGLVVTLWQLVEGALGLDSHPPETLAPSLVSLHKALATLEVDLPSYEDDLWRSRHLLDDDGAMAGLPEPDRSFVRTVFDQAFEDLAGYRFEVRGLHGEPHAGNRLLTEAGIVWLDLENVCRGPLEWDLAFLPASTAAQFDRDPDLVSLLRTMNSARVAVWCSKEAHFPVMARHARFHLALLHEMRGSR